MVVIGEIIHIAYFVIAGLLGFFLLLNLFRRTNKPGIVYDIVYAYCLIPFILRIVGIK